MMKNNKEKNNILLVLVICVISLIIIIIAWFYLFNNPDPEVQNILKWIMKSSMTFPALMAC